jgi:hypothetical protein
MKNGREIPDAKVPALPPNWRGDASPAAADATWGVDYSLRPMRAGEVLLVEVGDLIARFTLHLFLGGGIDLYIRGWRLVRWGLGERVFPPQSSHRVSRIYPPEVEGGEPTVKNRTFYEEILFAGSNRGAAAFEAAALAAARVAVARARREQQPNGKGADHDGVPF